RKRARMPMARILCVHEREPELQQLQSSVESGGYEVIRASTGKEALELLSWAGVDGGVLSCQIQSPGGMTRRNRIRPHYPEMRILLFTNPEEIKDIPLHVFRAYLKNPGPPDAVLEMIEV